MPHTSAFRIQFCAAVAVVAGALALSSVASATPIVLSNESSDATSASVLDATLDFVTAGAGVEQTLTLTLTNDTGSPNSFQVGEILFNASNRVTGVSLDSAILNGSTDVTGDWTLASGSSATGFGTFDYSVSNGAGIGSGDSLVFSFSLTAGGTKNPLNLNDGDFVNALSDVSGGGNAAYAAGFFDNGARGGQRDSAYGANVAVPAPEPGTAELLLIFGASAAAIGARRSRSE